jgi:hypothetical protein
MGESLWHGFKTAQFWRDDVLLTPVLILDQFEELFTLQGEAAREAFVDQLSHVVRGVRPPRTEEASTKAAATGHGSRATLSETAPDMRVVMSIREDFVGHLEGVADRIPQILDTRFRLLPLDRSAASEAMRCPPRVAGAGFSTRPFDVAETAVDEVLEFLGRAPSAAGSHGRDAVEPFQLQLICQHLEDLARAKQAGNDAEVVVGREDIGGPDVLSGLLESFYQRQLAALPGRRERQAVERLCVEYLISRNGRRLSVEEDEIKRLLGIDASVLRTLVDGRLLRSDQRADRTYYELSHDSLVSAVLGRSAFPRVRAVLYALIAAGFLTFGVFAAVLGLMVPVIYLSSGEFRASGLGFFVLMTVLYGGLAALGLWPGRLFYRRSRVWSQRASVSNSLN